MRTETIADLEAFLTIQVNALGESCLEVAGTLARLGDKCFDHGSYDKAEGYYLRAVQIRAAKSPLGKAAELANAHLSERLTQIEQLRQGREPSTSAAQDSSTAPYQQPFSPEHREGSEQRMTSQRDMAEVPQEPPQDSCLRAAAQASPPAARPKELKKDRTSLEILAELELEVELLKQTMHPSHPSVADALTKLADLYCRQRMYEKMETVLKEVIRIREANSGPDHPNVATAVLNLAKLYQVQGQTQLAEPLFRRAITVREKNFGKDHPRSADAKEAFAGFLRALDRTMEAQELEQQVSDVRVKVMLSR